MAITERQRHMVDDIRAAIAYFRDHEKVTETTLTAVLARAGVDNQGHFYSTVTSLVGKSDADDPEAKEMLREIKEGLASLGVKPKYLQSIRTYKPRPKKGQETEPVGGGESEIVLKLEPAMPSTSSQKTPAPAQRMQAFLDGPPPPLPSPYQNLNDIVQSFDPQNEVHAWNLGVFALQGLPQAKRELVSQSISRFYGFGEHY